jgi:hypothetical protein
MSKQTLIEAKLLDKIFNFFGGNGSTATKEKFLGTIKQDNPQLARAFSTWETDLLDLLQHSKKVYLKNGADTKDIDKLINRIKQG